MKSEIKLDHLFRHEYAKLVSILVRQFGPHHIDLVEDSVQDALLKAMQVWGYRNQPHNPTAWLYRVANNGLIDKMRRSSRIEFKQIDLILNIVDDSDINRKNTPGDDLLKMIFACCHPTLETNEQIMLALKLLCGLSVHEIARALMKKDEAVKKAITRAKQKFKDKIGDITFPGESELRKRLETVLKVIYLLFTESYKATDGEDLIKYDICEEAIQLGLVLKGNRQCNTPELNALLALMYFNASRFSTRIDAKEQLLTLDKQDRSNWNQEYIQRGFVYHRLSAQGRQLSRYHLEAGIASCHAMASTYEKTDWRMILQLYDLLLKQNPTPLIALNRIVVSAKINGSDIALSELDSLEQIYDLKHLYLFFSIKADLQTKNGQTDEAKLSLQTAIDLAENKIEKKFLRDKLISATKGY